MDSSTSVARLLSRFLLRELTMDEFLAEAEQLSDDDLDILIEDLRAIRQQL